MTGGHVYGHYMTGGHVYGHCMTGGHVYGHCMTGGHVYGHYMWSLLLVFIFPRCENVIYPPMFPTSQVVDVGAASGRSTPHLAAQIHQLLGQNEELRRELRSARQEAAAAATEKVLQ